MIELNLGILFVIGIAVFGGLVSAWMIQRIHIPQVLGYLLLGILIGQSGLQIVNKGNFESFGPFNLFALGIIGFLVGAELHFDTLRKYGKQLGAILIGEGVLAFGLVCAAVTVVMYHVCGAFAPALAAGVVFGAIASATDPASTIDVLWEYRSRGLLTTTIVAIVALDDALAMTLYGLGTSLAQILTGGQASVLAQVMHTVLELALACFMGTATGWLMNLVLLRAEKLERMFTFTVGLLLLLAGVVSYLDLDVILATMSCGIVISNLNPQRSKKLIDSIRNFSQPIYILFFVLVGCKLSIAHMPVWLWLIIGLYVAGRSVGKMVGAYLGAVVTGAAPVVRRYTGLGLFAQGGVAVGLSIMASHHLGNIQISDGIILGDVIIFGVTATTFIVQIIGPPLTMLAAKLAGETGKDITAEDVISSWKVSDVMSSDMAVFGENTPLDMVIREFSESRYMVYPVVNREGRVCGTLALNQIKEVLADTANWSWMLAADFMGNVDETVRTATPLREALAVMEQLDAEHMIVLNDKQEPVGVLDGREVRRSIERHIIEQQKHSAV